MRGYPVVTAQEMARVEALAHSEGIFMENAGLGIAQATENYILENQLEKRVSLLVGKGNNGGDAYVAGRKLLERGFVVVACHSFPVDGCSPLCQKQRGLFELAGGKVVQECQLEGVILDGLVGTGFKGKAEGLLAKLIEQANGSKLPILAIDIPSGVNGNTGEVGSVAIQATQTLFLELPKIGFFVGSGWDHVGELVPVPFGLPREYRDQAEIVAHLIDEEVVSSLVPPLRRSRHKYEAGYVLAVAGSEGMMGAACLSSYAALRAGAGLVRLFYPHACQHVGGPLELIKEPWNGKPQRIVAEQQRAKSMLIGPGLGRSKAVEKCLSALLPKVSVPALLDADVLYFLAKNPRWKLPKHVILTPHHGEMERLLQESVSLAACQQFVEKKRVTLVLKGAPTLLFHPGEKPLIITRGDPGMATAGAGDELSGVIAALLAQGVEAYSAAALGVYLHALAGEMAAFDKTSYSLIASDIIESLPDAFFSVT